MRTLILFFVLLTISTSSYAGSKKKTFDAPLQSVYDVSLNFVMEEWELLDTGEAKIEFRASRTCDGIAIFRLTDDGKTEVIVSTRKRQALVTWGEGGKKTKQLFKEIEKRLEK